MKGLVTILWGEGTGGQLCFPKRNRLIAALSDSVCIIDVGRNSGTDSTAMHCEKYGRNVLRVSMGGEVIGNGCKEYGDIRC